MSAPVAIANVYAQLTPCWWDEDSKHPDWDEHSKIKFPFTVYQHEKRIFVETASPLTVAGKAAGNTVLNLAENLKKKELNTPTKVKKILSGAKQLTYGDFRAAVNLPCCRRFDQVEHPFWVRNEDGTNISDELVAKLKPTRKVLLKPTLSEINTTLVTENAEMKKQVAALQEEVAELLVYQGLLGDQIARDYRTKKELMERIPNPHKPKSPYSHWTAHPQAAKAARTATK